MLNLAGFRLPPKVPREEIRRVQSSRRMPREESLQCGAVTSHSNMKEREWQQYPIHNPNQLRYVLTDTEKKKHRAYATRSQSPLVSLITTLPLTEKVPRCQRDYDKVVLCEGR